MFRINFLLIFCLILISFTSCYSPNYSVYVQNSNLEEVEVEVLRPAKIDISPEYYRLLLIENRGIDNRIRIIENNKYYKTIKETFIQDKSHINFCDELNFQLQHSPKFEIINKIAFPLTIYDNDSINWDSLQLVCRLNEADAAMIISNYQTEMLVSYNKYSYPLFSMNLYYYKFLYEIKAEMKLVDPFDKKVIDKITLNSRPKWEEERDHKLNIEQYCQNLSDNMSIYQAQIATKYAKRISPYWNAEYRKYYGSLNSDFNQTIKYVKNNEWDNARDIWQQYSVSTKKNLANRASFNLILAYEMEGELDKALKQSEKSYLEFKNYYSLQYGELIKKRINDQELLKKQLGE